MITYHIQQQKELHHGWCLHMYTCINTYVYMYIYTYTHICTYVYMYMYTAMERVALWMVPLRSTPLALSYGGNPELTASTLFTSSCTRYIHIYIYIYIYLYACWYIDIYTYMCTASTGFTSSCTRYLSIYICIYI